MEECFPLFGTLEGESTEMAFVSLNPFGRCVYQMLCGLAQFYVGKGFALKISWHKVDAMTGAAIDDEDIHQRR